MKSTNSQVLCRALKLRGHAASMREAGTASERALWQLLRGGQLGAVLRRQVPLLGFCIVDFLAVGARLVVESGRRVSRCGGSAKGRRAARSAATPRGLSGAAAHGGGGAGATGARAGADGGGSGGAGLSTTVLGKSLLSKSRRPLGLALGAGGGAGSLLSAPAELA